MSCLVKNSAFLMLMTFVVFLAATVSVSTSAATPESIDLCCDTGAPERPTPVQEGECSDPGCRCLSCDTLFNGLNSTTLEIVDCRTVSLWLLASSIPAGFIPSIDYPPESL